jgi:hypothetical protein
MLATIAALALATFGDVDETQTGLVLIMLHHPRLPRQVQLLSLLNAVLQQTSQM